MQIGVDTGDHDARVDGEKLDPDQRHPDIGIDDESLVEDAVDHIGEAARRGTVEIAAGAAGARG
jgi:hypothetical protein